MQPKHCNPSLVHVHLCIYYCPWSAIVYFTATVIAVDILQEVAKLQGYATNAGRYQINNPLNITGNFSIQLTRESQEMLNSSVPVTIGVYIGVKSGSELFLSMGRFSIKLIPTSKGQKILIELPRDETYVVEYDSIFNNVYDTIGISLKGSILELYVNCSLLKNITLMEQIPALLNTDIHLSGPALVCC